MVNSLFKQRACIENILKACLGLPPDHNMHLEHKLPKEFFKAANEKVELQNIVQNGKGLVDQCCRPAAKIVPNDISAATQVVNGN